MSNADFQRSDEKIPTASQNNIASIAVVGGQTLAAGLHSSGLSLNKGRRKIGQPLHTANYTSKGAPT
jgi:hypothetical protein